MARAYHDDPEMAFLAPEEEKRGKGFGGALTQPVLDIADEEGLLCNVETTKGRSVTFYERYGFKMIHEKPLPKGSNYLGNSS